MSEELTYKAAEKLFSDWSATCPTVFVLLIRADGEWVLTADSCGEDVYSLDRQYLVDTANSLWALRSGDYRRSRFAVAEVCPDMTPNWYTVEELDRPDDDEDDENTDDA